jgi:hypothetical protein
MSPHYSAVRDGSQSTIPAEHLPAGYAAPPFFVELVGKMAAKRRNNASRYLFCRPAFYRRRADI